MVQKNKTTWDVVGWDADVRIIEARATEYDVTVKSYEEAKKIALEKLRSHIRPYLARIEELESDQFLKKGAMPPMRIWRSQYGKRLVVTAKTKKRAAELVDETKHGFNTYWYEHFGDPWCDLAQREAVWVPQCDANGATTDKFQRCLMRDEAMEILREYARPYRDVDPRELLPLLGNKRTDKGTTEDGVAYEITTEAWRDHYNSAVMTVQFRICDGSGIIWIPPIVFERDFPKESVAWKDEGF